MAALVITPADVVLQSGTKTTKTVEAATTITAGDICTLDASQNVVLANNSTQILSGGGATNGGIYIALCGASPGQEIVLASSGAVVDIGVTPIIGNMMVLGGAGEILPHDELAEDNWLTFLGYGNASDYFVLNPIVTNTQVPSAGSLI